MQRRASPAAFLDAQSSRIFHCGSRTATEPLRVCPHVRVEQEAEAGRNGRRHMCGDEAERVGRVPGAEYRTLDAAHDSSPAGCMRKLAPRQPLLHDRGVWNRWNGSSLSKNHRQRPEGKVGLLIVHGGVPPLLRVECSAREAPRLPALGRGSCRNPL